MPLGMENGVLEPRQEAGVMTAPVLMDSLEPLRIDPGKREPPAPSCSPSPSR